MASYISFVFLFPVVDLVIDFSLNLVHQSKSGFLRTEHPVPCCPSDRTWSIRTDCEKHVLKHDDNVLNPVCHIAWNIKSDRNAVWPQENPTPSKNVLRDWITRCRRPGDVGHLIDPISYGLCHIHLNKEIYTDLEQLEVLGSTMCCISTLSISSHDESQASGPRSFHRCRAVAGGFAHLYNTFPREQSGALWGQTPRQPQSL
ncbi:hypothetical protein IRJ41_011841 [Triplophysa rosa]|uniref:THAP-type domain-containing protein n=1 Tax=Triplophysa rosa TaxID=992332 RepID=A0A9W7TCG9_TRIRA|nr:hypothetical protein IRJ41_011841 [Triplophysa rosa]